MQKHLHLSVAGAIAFVLLALLISVNFPVAATSRAAAADLASADAIVLTNSQVASEVAQATAITDTGTLTDTAAPTETATITAAGAMTSTATEAPDASAPTSAVTDTATLTATSAITGAAAITEAASVTSTSAAAPTGTEATTATLPLMAPTQVPTTGAKLFQQGNWNQPHLNVSDQKLSDGSVAAQFSQALGVQMGPSRLMIPSIGLDTAVADRGWHGVEGPNGALISQWDEVFDAAGWHMDSALPGRQGNVVISGHNNVHGAVFRDLHRLTPGETIYMEYGKVRYEYAVQSIEIEPEVGASQEQRAANAAYLQQTDDARLTLITCWPWYGDSHRVFVVANLASVKMSVTEQPAQ